MSRKFDSFPSLQSLLIMLPTGIPLLYQKLNPKALSLDPALLSGFIAALKQFSNVVIDKDKGDFHVDYGKRIISLISGNYTLFVGVHSKEANLESINEIKQIQNLFEESFKRILEDNQVFDTKIFQEFRPIIIDRFGMTEPSLNWVPVLVNKEELKKIDTNDYELIDYVDGEKTVEEIYNSCLSLSKDNIIYQMAQLWSKDLLQITHLLEKLDVIVPHKSIASYMRSCPDLDGYLEIFPKKAKYIPLIIRNLDGKTNVEQIMSKFPKDSQIIYDILDYLFNQEAIEILTPEKRRIVINKEIFSISLDVANSLFNKKEVICSLKETLDQTSSPEILAQLNVGEDDCQIIYSLTIYDQLSASDILKLSLFGKSLC